jgi:FlgD Ig-like domain
MGIVGFNRAAFYPWFEVARWLYCPENSSTVPNIPHSRINIVLKLGKQFSLAFIVFAITLISSVSGRAATTISFKLDEPCRTSAGVYKTDGTLVRTLWSNVRYYAAGTYTTNWDGKDDSGNNVSAGTYVAKVLENNVQYVWDGTIGNTSTAAYGFPIHRGFLFIQDLTVAGTNAFYCSGYNEGQYGFREFYTTSPQQLENEWLWDTYVSGGGTNIVSAPGIANRNWNFTTADADRVYFACDASYDQKNNQLYGLPGCIVASRVSDQSVAMFSSGSPITNTSDCFPNGIYVGTQPGLSGLAVQLNGNILAAAVAPENKIYLFDKTTGATSSPASISINAPGRMNFATNGNLWVTTSNSVVCFTNMNGTPAVALTITAGLSAPLAVAANSTNVDLVLVADGGSSQQVKAFDTKGTSLWTYGLAGGYYTNGPAVANNKFWFQNFTVNAISTVRTAIPDTFITFASDGTFWVGDEWNNRIMHFDDSQNYLEQIMYQPASYSVSVDKNNPSRVFNNFLEFNVDYTKPLSNAWTLVNNWGNVDTNHNIAGGASGGFYGLQTFANGRTYALIDNRTNRYANNQMAKELCELTSNGIRFTGTYPGAIQGTSIDNSFGADGSALAATANGNHWYSSPLTGFDGNNNPTWGAQTTIATAPTGGSNPMNQNIETFKTTPITTNNIVICFDDGIGTNYHLGGIALNGNNFLWRASPAVPYFDGHGGYEISNGVNYAGADVQALDRHVVFGYHGEFFRSQGQAGQHFHYYDDGLFIGQFGEASLGYQCGYFIPAFSGNAFGPVMVKINNEYYCYENDESAHGPQRWHLVNANNVREVANTIALNGSAILTNQPVAFPAVVTGVAGNQAAPIRWSTVTGASSYNVRYATNNGGPYFTLALSTPATNAVISGLDNGTTYYFAVTAVIDGNEGLASEQVKVVPFDSTKTVLAVGSQSSALTPNNLTYVNGVLVYGCPVIEVNSNNPALGWAAFLDTVHQANYLTPQDEDNYGLGNLMDETIGTKGYVIYNWGGDGIHLSNVLPPFTVTQGSGWINNAFMFRQVYVNGKAGKNIPQPTLGDGLVPNPVGTINISVSDSNYHLLTVMSPVMSGVHGKVFTTTLASTNGTSASYSVNDLATSLLNDRSGTSQIFQFLFKGDSILTMDATGGQNATLLALFLDDAGVSSSPALIPPTLLQPFGP